MIAIVDYRAGNLTSVLRAVRSLGHDARITDDPSVVASAERVIFPGVGAAGETMENLRKLGLDRVLREDVFASGKPLLGICIGIQVVFEHSDEDGGVGCLGLLPGSVRRFPERAGLKIPQIGWNAVKQVRPHPIFTGVPDNAAFYFVNSYHVAPARAEDVIGMTDYGVSFPSAVARDNLVATQFHLEKSGRVGLEMLGNFCEWQMANDE